MYDETCFLFQPEKRMKLEDFVRNLRQIDGGHDLDPELLSGIYERIRSQAFRPGSDHVTQVIFFIKAITFCMPLFRIHFVYYR